MLLMQKATVLRQAGWILIPVFLFYGHTFFFFLALIILFFSCILFTEYQILDISVDVILNCLYKFINWVPFVSAAGLVKSKQVICGWFLLKVFAVLSLSYTKPCLTDSCHSLIMHESWTAYHSFDQVLVAWTTNLNPRPNLWICHLTFLNYSDCIIKHDEANCNTGL